MTGHDAVARIDRCDLRVLNVLGLRFRDLYLRLELGRIGDAREIIARFNALPDLHR